MPFALTECRCYIIHFITRHTLHVHCTLYITLRTHPAVIQCESNNLPLRFSNICPERLGIFSPNFTGLLYVPVYARLQIFIQLSATLTKLCLIAARPPSSHHKMLRMSPSAETHAGWSHLIWHNFVTVGDNRIKICDLA